MSFWSALAPIAQIGATALGGPWAGAAVGGATGLMHNNEKRRQEQQQLNAQANAEQASWARRDGRGSIPQAQRYGNTAFDDAFAGGVGGYMQGQAFDKAGGGGRLDWQKWFGGGGTPPSEAEAGFNSRPSMYGIKAQPLPFK